MFVIFEFCCGIYLIYCCHFCSSVALTGLLEGWCPRISMYCNRDCIFRMYKCWVCCDNDRRHLSENPYRHIEPKEFNSEQELGFV